MVMGLDRSAESAVASFLPSIVTLFTPTFSGKTLDEKLTSVDCPKAIACQMGCCCAVAGRDKAAPQSVRARGIFDAIIILLINVRAIICKNETLFLLCLSQRLIFKTLTFQICGVALFPAEKKS
jgi:hypothetical protein